MPMHGLRLAVPRKYFCDLLDDEVRARFEEALERLRAAGARIDDVEIQHAPDIAPVYLHIVMADAAAYHATALETMPEQYTPNVRLRLEMGAVRAGRRLRAGARGTRTAEARGGRGARPARRADAADAADSGAADRREHGPGRRASRSRCAI